MDWIAQNLWLIPVLPLLAAGVIALLKQRQRKLAATLAIGSMVLAFLLSLRGVCATLLHPATACAAAKWPISTGSSSAMPSGCTLGWVLDPLTAVMLVMVSFVGLLIFIFSVGYMAHDENFTRFFCFLSLFAAAMLGVVIANSLLLFFICWEIVGLTSYLLIGFWYHKPSAAAAAKKAFITTRIGDLGLLLGMVWLYAQTGTLIFYDGGSGCLEQSALGQAGRPDHEPRPGGVDRHRAADFLRRGRQIRPGAAARLAAGRDGRPDAGQRAHSRGHDGGGGRFPRGAGLSVDGGACLPALRRCQARCRW